MHVTILLPLILTNWDGNQFFCLIFVEKITAARMNDQPQPEKIRGCLEASLKKDMKAMRMYECRQFLSKQKTSKMFGTIEIKR